MTVCRYFHQGNCRYGENCRFEHPRGEAQQRNLFGGGGDNWSGGGGGSQHVTFRDSFGTNGQQQGGNNPFKWSAGQGATQGNAQPTTLDLVNNLPNDMEVWEKSKMWPFSCFSVDKETMSLPEFDDISVEELRQEAYGALKSGNIQPYVQKVQLLTSEYQAKRNQFKHMSLDVKQKLVMYIEEARKKKAASSSTISPSTFGGCQSAPSVLGQANQPPQSGNTASLFGKPSGRSVFGGSSAVGGGASTFSFNQAASSGQTSSPSVFGGGSTISSGGIFGKSQGMGGSMFGGGQSQTSNVFGSQQMSSAENPGSRPFQTAPSSVGQAAAPSLFGNQGSSEPSGSVFGCSANAGTQQASLFGAVQGPTPTQSLFGKPMVGSNFSGNLSTVFGGPGTSSQNNPGGVEPSSLPSLFGQQQTMPQQQTLFGKPSAAGNTSHGQSNFANSVPLSVSSTGDFQSQQQPTTQSNSAVNPGRYTPLEDLTELEVKEFKASSFTLGRIPLRPPPKEFVNI